MEQSPYRSLKPLVVNENWGLLEGYLAGEKTRLVTQLCNCNEDNLKFLQGQIRMIDQLLGLKQNVTTLGQGSWS